MDTSIFVAQILALVYLSIGVGILADKKYYQKMMDAIYKDSSAIYLGGAMALVVGYLLVTYHNYWVKDWTVLITLVGWMALVKGVLLLAFPRSFLAWSKGMFSTKNLGTMNLFVLALGLVFGYFGFIA